MQDRNAVSTAVSCIAGRDPDPQYDSQPGGRAVVQAIDDSFQDHWGFVQEPFEQHYERLMAYVNARKDYDPSLWFVAMAGDRIAGFSLCYPSTDEDSELAWLQTLGYCVPGGNRGWDWRCCTIRSANFTAVESTRWDWVWMQPA